MNLIYYKGKLIPQVFSARQEAEAEINLMVRLRNTRLSDAEIAAENLVMYNRKKIIDAIFDVFKESFIHEDEFQIETIETKALSIQRVIAIHEYLRTFFTDRQ